MKKYKSKSERRNNKELNQEVHTAQIEEMILDRYLFELAYFPELTDKKEPRTEMIYSTSNPGIINPKVKENYTNIINTFKSLLGASI